MTTCKAMTGMLSVFGFASLTAYAAAVGSGVALAGEASPIRSTIVEPSAGLRLVALAASADSGGDAALTAATRLLEQARLGIEAAIRHAEISLGPHQPGSGHTKLHMQRVVNQLEGGKSSAYRALPDDPAQTDHAVLPGLRELRAALGERRPPTEVLQAVQQAILYVEAASRHAQNATVGTSIEEVHKQAGLAAAMLVAARGMEQTESPVTGSLSYATRQLSASQPGH